MPLWYCSGGIHDESVYTTRANVGENVEKNNVKRRRGADHHVRSRRHGATI